MNFSKTFSSGILIAVVGIVMFSAKAIMVKLAYKYQVSAVHLLLFRMLFSVPFYVLIAFYVKPQNDFDSSEQYMVVEQLQEMPLRCL